MTKETDLERIKKVVDWLIFDKVVKTKRELADKMGYTESSLSQIINGKVELSKRFINKLSIVDNRLNLEFLISGEGQMLNRDKNPFSQMTEKEIGDTMTETFTEELMKAYKRGEIYPSEVHNRIVAEKDKRIEELQRENWELQKKIDEMLK